MRIPFAPCLLIPILLTCSPAGGEEERDLPGKWIGEVDVPGAKFKLVFEVALPQAGTYSGSLMAPKLSPHRVPLSLIYFKDRKVVFEVDTIGANFTGRISANGTRISGDWKQGDFELPLRLERNESGEAATLNRPQHPSGRSPYLVEEVTFSNARDGKKLAGTLTLPKDAFGKRPGLVLLSDQGPHDRNASILGHQPFLVLADYLTRRGFAVLRFDDRGTGQSEGEFRFSTYRDFVGDAAAALDLLRTRKEVDPGKLGVIGQGEGASIAALLATEREDVRCLVQLGGPGLPGTETMLSRVHAIGKASRAPPSLVSLAQDFFAALFDLALKPAPDPARIAAIGKKFEADVKALEPGEAASLVHLGAVIQSQVASIESPWMLNFLRHDPGPVLERITCPVLAVHGEKDLEVFSKLHLGEIEKHLEAGGNPQAQVRELEKLNHLFQECETGLPDEYGHLTETISPRLLKGVALWLSGVLR